MNRNNLGQCISIFRVDEQGNKTEIKGIKTINVTLDNSKIINSDTYEAKKFNSLTNGFSMTAELQNFEMDLNLFSKLLNSDNESRFELSARSTYAPSKLYKKLNRLNYLVKRTKNRRICTKLLKKVIILEKLIKQYEKTIKFHNVKFDIK